MDLTKYMKSYLDFVQPFCMEKIHKIITIFRNSMNNLTEHLHTVPNPPNIHRL